MRYYTFAQEVWNEETQELAKYLDEQRIKYTLGADFSSELQPLGYTGEYARPINPCRPPQPDGINIGYLVNTFVILGDEDDLTAIKMRFDRITILKNRKTLMVKNFFRKVFFM